MGDETRSKFKRICVFCGSNSGNRTVFSDAALDLGREMVNRRISLIYGGGSVGLMGMISQAVYDGGCHVLGVIPKALVPIEIRSMLQRRLAEKFHSSDVIESALRFNHK